MNLAVIIPTVHEYSEFCKSRVDEICLFSNMKNLNIYVCGDKNLTVDDDRIKFYPQPKNLLKGAPQPVNYLLQYITEKYIILLNDDMFIINDLLDCVDIFEQDDNDIIGLCQSTWLQYGHGHIHDECRKDLKECKCLSFPMFTKEFLNLNLNNLLFNTNFFHHYSDCWLSYYVYYVLNINYNIYGGYIKPYDSYPVNNYMHDNSDLSLYSQLIMKHKRNILEKYNDKGI